MTHITGLFYGSWQEFLAWAESMQNEECQIRMAIPLDITTSREKVSEIMAKLPARHNSVWKLIMNQLDNFVIKMFLRKLNIEIYDDSKDEKRLFPTKSPTFTILSLRKDQEENGVENL